MGMYKSVSASARLNNGRAFALELAGVESAASMQARRQAWAEAVLRVSKPGALATDGCEKDPGCHRIAETRLKVRAVASAPCRPPSVNAGGEPGGKEVFTFRLAESIE